MIPGMGGMGTGGGGGGIMIPRAPQQGAMPGPGAPQGAMPGGGGPSFGPGAIERIVSSVDAGTLLRALAAKIDGGGGGMAGAMGMPGTSMDAPIVDHMAPWGQTLVRVPLTQRRPIVDLSQTTDPPQQPASLISSFGGDSGNIAPWAAATAG